MRAWCVLTLFWGLIGCGDQRSSEASTQNMTAEVAINTNELYELMAIHRQYIIDFFAYESVTIVLQIKEVSAVILPVEYRVVDPVVDHSIHDLVLPYNLKTLLFYKKENPLQSWEQSEILPLTLQEQAHLHHMIDKINLALALEDNPEMPEDFSISLIATHAPSGQSRIIELFPDDGVLGREMQFVVIDLQEQSPLDRSTIELPYFE
jgi:hypothetical protein